jgi:hypothetical protein
LADKLNTVSEIIGAFTLPFNGFLAVVFPRILHNNGSWGFLGAILIAR